MGARSIPPPPLVVRRVLHVLWPLVGVVVTGLMVPVIVAGAFMVVVDRRARLFRASCLAVVLMWVDIRMLLGCWALWARSPDHSSPTWREDHERLFSQALDSLMYYARRWVRLEVVLADRMHFGTDDEPLITLARHAGPGRLARHRLADGAHRGPAAADRARRGAALGPGHRHHPQPARLVLRALGQRRRRRPRRRA